ncbi:MAG: CDP-diacylglycerol--serine O-phosphatidyltransferase [Deltaproteobacteria bacterium]|nr:CDP-diacylglycerol--serine O-phosphatidyltransferase [Deltaproteobacteria bacterium]
MKIRKLMFVLPNLFTVSSIFCGFYAMTLCTGAATPTHLYQAALSIFFAIFFDGFDGRVARLTKTQSDFGVELDSLADVCSFGVAPGLLVYKWALEPLGIWGLFASFAFAACGALRLARFNVLAHRNHAGSSRYFVGLPIPLAAGMVISLVIAHHMVHGEATMDAHVPIAIVVLALALLMVSTVRYRTFKDARPSKKSALVFMLVCALGVIVATQLKPAYVLVAYFSAYLVMGLIESVVTFPKRRSEARAAAAAAGTTAATAAVDAEDELADDEDDDEDSVDEEEYI